MKGCLLIDKSNHKQLLFICYSRITLGEAKLNHGPCQEAFWGFASDAEGQRKDIEDTLEVQSY